LVAEKKRKGIYRPDGADDWPKYGDGRKAEIQARRVKVAALDLPTSEGGRLKALLRPKSMGPIRVALKTRSGMQAS
jgi:hypothetical protein